MSGERIPNHKEKADTSNDSSPQTKWDDLSSVAFAKDIKNQHETSIEEIHQNVENPLTTDNLKTIMSLYSESSNSSIYHCLEKANAENKNYTKNTEDEKSFRESLYADWLESLRKMPKEEIQKSGKAFYVMGEYALSHPEVKTRQQLTELIDSNQSFNSKQKEVLIDLVDDKCYDHASSIGWDFARNCQIKPKHRLYMNVPQDEVYHFAQLVKAGCDQSDVKYDFKLEDTEARTDSFMMYLTDEMLNPTIEVLKSIVSNHPEIIKRLGKPPILSGKINAWLGYGSEPKGSRESFNGVRAEIIQKVVDEHIVNYAKLHGHDPTNASYRGKKLNLNQYIAIQETNAYMQTLADDYKRVKRRNEIQGNPDKSVEEELGYTAEQMKVGSPLYNTLANFYVTRREIGDTDALKYLHKKGSTALEYPSEYSSSIKLTIGDGNSRIVRDRRPVSSPHGSFGIGPENTTFRHIILKGMINDTAEIKSIQEEILKACETKGIDPETFCFDKYVLEKA